MEPVGIQVKTKTPKMVIHPKTTHQFWLPDCVIDDVTTGRVVVVIIAIV